MQMKTRHFAQIRSILGMVMLAAFLMLSGCRDAEIAAEEAAPDAASQFEAAPEDATKQPAAALLEPEIEGDQIDGKAQISHISYADSALTLTIKNLTAENSLLSIYAAYSPFSRGEEGDSSLLYGDKANIPAGESRDLTFPAPPNLAPQGKIRITHLAFEDPSDDYTWSTP